MASKSYNTLESLTLRDVGVTGPRASTVIEANNYLNECIPARMAAEVFKRILWGGDFSKWRALCASVTPYFGDFSDFRLVTTMKDNKYDGGKLMLSAQILAKYLNPETKQVEERDVCQTGMWTPWMVAEAANLGLEASRVVHMIKCNGHPMARKADGSFDPAFTDEKYPADTTKGGRTFPMEREFSAFDATCTALSKCVIDGILRDSFLKAKELYAQGEEMASPPTTGTTFYDYGAAEEALRYLHEKKPKNLDEVKLPAEVEKKMAARVLKRFQELDNPEFMSHPELQDSGSSIEDGWKTIPGTSSRARPELNLMESQVENGDDDGEGVADPTQARRAASGPGRGNAVNAKKKTVVSWKRENAKAFKDFVGYEYSRPVSVKDSLDYFREMKFKPRTGPKAIKVWLTWAMRNPEGRLVLIPVPVTDVGCRWLARRDVILRTRVVPKISTKDKGASMRFNIMEVQILADYSQVMSLGRSTPIPPIFGTRGPGQTRNLPASDEVTGLYLEALGDYSAEDLKQLQEAELMYYGDAKKTQKALPAPGDDTKTNPPAETKGKRSAPEETAQPAAKKGKASTPEPKEEDAEAAAEQGSDEAAEAQGGEEDAAAEEAGAEEAEEEEAMDENY